MKFPACTCSDEARDNAGHLNGCPRGDAIDAWYDQMFGGREEPSD